MLCNQGLTLPLDPDLLRNHHPLFPSPRSGPDVSYSEVSDANHRVAVSSVLSVSQKGFTLNQIRHNHSKISDANHRVAVPSVLSVSKKGFTLNQPRHNHSKISDANQQGGSAFCVKCQQEGFYTEPNQTQSFKNK